MVGLIRLTPRFDILLATMMLSIILTATDILAVTKVISGAGLRDLTSKHSEACHTKQNLLAAVNHLFRSHESYSAL